jgi:hypothetical protein
VKCPLVVRWRSKFILVVGPNSPFLVDSFLAVDQHFRSTHLFSSIKTTQRKRIESWLIHQFSVSSDARKTQGNGGMRELRYFHVSRFYFFFITCIAFLFTGQTDKECYRICQPVTHHIRFYGKIFGLLYQIINFDALSTDENSNFDNNCQRQLFKLCDSSFTMVLDILSPLFKKIL